MSAVTKPLLRFLDAAITRRRVSQSLRNYRAIKAVSLRVDFLPGALADFEGLMGSSARKTLRWSVFSENGLASPGGKSKNLQEMTGALKD